MGSPAKKAKLYVSFTNPLSIDMPVEDQRKSLTFGLFTSVRLVRDGEIWCHTEGDNGSCGKLLASIKQSQGYGTVYRVLDNYRYYSYLDVEIYKTSG